MDRWHGILSSQSKGCALKVKTQSKKVNKSWLNDHVNDPYVKLAQKEAYRARAAYKLKEIDEVFGLFKPGMVVVDLGSSPGAWSQYVRRRMASNGAVTGGLDATLLALDMLPMLPIDGVTFLQGDFREVEVMQKLEMHLQGRRVDVVISDMAPNLSGIASADAARMFNLVELAVDFCVHHLHPKGALVAKVFHGGGYQEMVDLFDRHFVHAKSFKPKASRDKSAENFLIGRALKLSV